MASSATESLVLKVRDLVLARATRDTAHSKDLEAVKSDDWFIKRFVIEKQLDKVKDKDPVESAAVAVEKCLQWRKENNMDAISERDFPRELLEKSYIQFDEELNIVYVRSRMYKKFAGWNLENRRYADLFFEKMYKSLGSPGKKGMIVFDTTGGGMSNNDFGWVKHIIDVSFTYYPQMASKVYMYEAAWYIRPILGAMTALLPSKHSDLLKNITKDAYAEAIGKNEVPDFMGGPKKLPFVIPSDAPSLEDMGKTKEYDEKATSKYREFLESLQP